MRSRWLITRLHDCVRLDYFNLQSGKKYPLGWLSPETDDAAVVAWILATGEPAAGDIVALSDGTELRFTGARLVLHGAHLNDGLVVTAHLMARA